VQVVTAREVDFVLEQTETTSGEQNSGYCVAHAVTGREIRGPMQRLAGQYS
jgi:hypothetical protein